MSQAPPPNPPVPKEPLPRKAHNTRSGRYKNQDKDLPTPASNAGALNPSPPIVQAVPRTPVVQKPRITITRPAPVRITVTPPTPEHTTQRDPSPVVVQPGDNKKDDKKDDKKGDNEGDKKDEGKDRKDDKKKTRRKTRKKYEDDIEHELSPYVYCTLLIIFLIACGGILWIVPSNDISRLPSFRSKGLDKYHTILERGCYEVTKLYRQEPSLKSHWDLGLDHLAKLDVEMKPFDHIPTYEGAAEPEVRAMQNYWGQREDLDGLRQELKETESFELMEKMLLTSLARLGSQCRNTLLQDLNSILNEDLEDEKARHKSNFKVLWTSWKDDTMDSMYHIDKCQGELLWLQDLTETVLELKDGSPIKNETGQNQVSRKKRDAYMAVWAHMQHASAHFRVVSEGLLSVHEVFSKVQNIPLDHGKNNIKAVWRELKKDQTAVQNLLKKPEEDKYFEYLDLQKETRYCKVGWWERELPNRWYLWR